MTARNNRVVILPAAEYVEIRPPVGGRTMLSLENLGANAVAYAEDTTPQVGLDPELAAAGAANFAAIKRWDGDEAPPQGAVWLYSTSGSRVKVVEGAP